jgi:hypothetical protein
MFFGLPNSPNSDPLVRGTDPDPSPFDSYARCDEVNQPEFRSRIGSGSRQTKISLEKEKLRKFMFEEFSVWMGSFPGT